MVDTTPAGVNFMRWTPRHIANDDGLPVPFHVPQSMAWDAVERFIALVAGTQGGKTAFGSFWLHREIYGEQDSDGKTLREGHGSGDYIAVTASYDLFKNKMLPSMLRTFEEIYRCGRLWTSDRVIELADPVTGKFWANKSTDRMWGRIMLRSAVALGSLESATAKALWCDEAGQDDFTEMAWRALRRRVAIHLGRVLFTTTLYNLGWFKTLFIDKAQAGGVVSVVRAGNGGEIEQTINAKESINLIQYDSIVNPMFAVSEFQEAERDLPPEDFAMFYRGRVGKLRSLIYDVFTRNEHTCAPFKIPRTWKRWIGMDFGGVHTCAVFIAEHPVSGMLYLYREYLAGGRIASEHVESMLADEPALQEFHVFGGAGSEDQWRSEFTAGGLYIHEPPVRDVEVGILRGYALLKRGRLKVFTSCAGIIHQFETYKRKRDKQGEVTKEIQDKAKYHYLDAYRYVSTALAVTDDDYAEKESFR